MRVFCIPMLAILGAAPAARAGGTYAGGPVTGGGSVSGTVTTTAKASTDSQAVTKDQPTCGHAKRSEAVIVGRGGALRNAVVYLDKITAGKPATPQKLGLDQIGCTYVPHVQAAVRGSEIEFHSNDPILHNVHGAGGVQGKDMLFNVAMPMKDQRIKKKLKKTGLITVTCDAGHTWMRAYVQVFDHPYFAVTGDDGSFRLADVPPGTYDLVVWHEQLGERRVRVTVAAGADSKTPLALP
ncbi:MAG TPA: carboxypeptidase regulatory-like domain-containing protein [Kofleriaceae bacterium]|nr:carboxypeptidase regulatory-like domain-containing protein [Kofleriaceae bacterium]